MREQKKFQKNGQVVFYDGERALIIASLSDSQRSILNLILSALQDDVSSPPWKESGGGLSQEI
jgi:hypothetical protein